MPEYKYAVSSQAVELFTFCTKREREHLLRIFQSIASAPYQEGDCVRPTASGRDLQVKRYGKWLLTFWRDHAVREVRIVGLERIIP
jgi:hypothetical protein